MFIYKWRKDVSEKRISNDNDIINESASNILVTGGRTKQNVGFMIMMVGMFIAAVTLRIAADDDSAKELVMLFVLVMSLVLSGFGFKTLSIIMTSLQIVAFITYTVFGILVNGKSFEPLMIMWVVAPGMAILGMSIFSSGIEKMRLGNKVLRRQVEELAILDPLTGLYNLRGLYMDMQTQISYAERNGKAISLMIVKLRYPEEMKAVLKKDQYSRVVKGLSQVICNTVRLEDKVYCIGPDGQFAILLTCDKPGCKIVEGRMRPKIEDGPWTEGISNKPIRVEVKIGYIEYSKERLNRDAGGFLAAVEEEVEYDI